MSDGDLYISSGECFYGEGQISDPRFIPCGNAAVAGTQACCFQGDFCLAENVCYDNDTSVTYITGCTDATYSSSKCPHKAGYPDQQWVALARCDGDDIALFSGCAHHKDEVVIEHEDCTCDAASALVSNTASGQPTLNQIALLPTTAGGTISFNPTALPTATPSSHPSSGGLSTGAKAGIGVGVGVGVPVIAATIFMFFFLRRKRRRTQEQQQQEQGHPQPPPSELPPEEARTQMQQQQSSPPPMYSPDTQTAQYGWLRHKPELHGESAHKVELSADSYPQDNSGGVNRMDSIQNTPYENYPPSDYDRSQHGGETPSLQFVSPQSTGNTEQPQSVAGHQRTGSSNMDPISEHHFDDRQHYS
ncbi:hypothetical protein F5Y01DRAFT_137092 [Xylaria sp. FL0043]|nr:hypothetical protein F5Y01DRAFT_137092 [Xylaria sp. FL0043]